MSQAVRAGGFLFLAGQVAEGADVSEQTLGVLSKIGTLLDEAEMNKTSIVSANIWLTDIEDFDAMNAARDSWVAPGQPPARACVQSRLAIPELRVEIAVIAFAEAQQ